MNNFFIYTLLFAVGPLYLGVGGGDLADRLFVGGAGDFQAAPGRWFRRPRGTKAVLS